jgi:nucleoside-diphosphate-sugar epimerase
MSHPPAGFDPVLVTGGAGFVGSCVIHELLAQGRRVHAVLRDPARAWRLRGPLEAADDRLVVHRADLTDAEATREAVRAARPAAVLHLAAHGAYESQADAEQILRTNVLGTYNLLKASAGAGVKAFVNTGSSSEYGLKTEPMREGDRPEPNSIYAVAKAAQTHLCSLAARRRPMGVVTYRLFSVYGPWEEPTRLMPTLLRRARAGLPLEMVGPDVARDFVYVDDVVEALLDLPAAARLRGDVINLGTGVQTSLREVVEAVLEVTGARPEVRWGAMPPRQWDTDRWCADVSLARLLLGWVPRHTLRQGLARMAAWTQQRGEDAHDTSVFRGAA